MAMHLLASEIVALTADCHGLSSHLCETRAFAWSENYSHMLGMRVHKLCK